MKGCTGTGSTMIRRCLLWRSAPGVLARGPASEGQPPYEALSLTGKPFPAEVQAKLAAAAAKEGFTSPYWISARMCDFLGVVPEKRWASGTSLSAIHGQKPVELFNAEQTTNPAIFGPDLCVKQKIPVSFQGKVMSADGVFAELRANMMEKNYKYPHFLPADVFTKCLGIPLKSDAESITIAHHGQIYNLAHCTEPDLAFAVLSDCREHTFIDPHLGGESNEYFAGPLASLSLGAYVVRHDLQRTLWGRAEDYEGRGHTVPEEGPCVKIVVEGRHPVTLCPIEGDRRTIEVLNAQEQGYAPLGVLVSSPSSSSSSSGSSSSPEIAVDVSPAVSGLIDDNEDADEDEERLSSTSRASSSHSRNDVEGHGASSTALPAASAGTSDTPPPSVLPYAKKKPISITKAPSPSATTNVGGTQKTTTGSQTRKRKFDEVDEILNGFHEEHAAATASAAADADEAAGRGGAGHHNHQQQWDRRRGKQSGATTEPIDHKAVAARYAQYQRQRRSGGGGGGGSGSGGGGPSAGSAASNVTKGSSAAGSPANDDQQSSTRSQHRKSGETPAQRGHQQQLTTKRRHRNNDAANGRSHRQQQQLAEDEDDDDEARLTSDDPPPSSVSAFAAIAQRSPMPAPFYSATYTQPQPEQQSGGIRLRDDQPDGYGRQQGGGGPSQESHSRHHPQWLPAPSSPGQPVTARQPQQLPRAANVSPYHHQSTTLGPVPVAQYSTTTQHPPQQFALQQHRAQPFMQQPQQQQPAEGSLLRRAEEPRYRSVTLFIDPEAIAGGLVDFVNTPPSASPHNPSQQSIPGSSTGSDGMTTSTTMCIANGSVRIDLAPLGIKVRINN